MIAPDRVWVVMDRYGFPRTVNDAAVDAKRDEDDLNQFNRSPRFGGPYTTHEYRLHRPVDWRTGVPDAETKRRCEALFALRLPDGSVLRECVPQFDGTWWWGGAAPGGRSIDPEYLGVQWCPEDEIDDAKRLAQELQDHNDELARCRAERDALRAEVERLRADAPDAARYRWLRDGDGTDSLHVTRFGTVDVLVDGFLDAAIDAAREAQEGK